jgi:hypothetical protein
MRSGVGREEADIMAEGFQSRTEILGGDMGAAT